ncbi:MAG: hypothetical protein U5P41_06715 [Gammaproteobacteria bacterium]|nr:hypothetical protein [Gammaproteobacteria bacterium]
MACKRLQIIIMAVFFALAGSGAAAENRYQVEVHYFRASHHG